MDIQFIGESSLAIAQYVTGYVTKAEKSNMQEVWEEVSSHQTIYSKLWSFGVRCLRSRECGLYEASDLLLGDHLCGKSLTVKWVDVSQSHNRKRRLKDHSKLTEMRECNPNSTDIFEANLIDTFYPERPDNMEDVCLYDFVADYVRTGVDKDGNTTYRRLTKSVLPNHKLYNPNKEDEKESYYYSLLLLLSLFAMRVTWSKRERVPKMHSSGTWNTTMLSTHTLRNSGECYLPERMCRKSTRPGKQLCSVPMPDPSEEDDGPQVAGEATSAMHDVANLQENDDSAPCIDDLVSSFNSLYPGTFYCKTRTLQ